MKNCQFLLVFAGLIGMLGCKIFSNQDNDQQENAELNEAESKDSENDLSHPDKPTAWDTQTLLLRQNNRFSGEITKCQAELAEASELATNEESLINAKNTLIPIVEKNISPYHWCFYAMMRDLDTILDATTFTINQKADIFQKDIKKLWILARVLVTITNDDEYFDYLRQRYIDLSTQIFGRQIEVVGNSLDERLSAPKKQEPERNVD